MRIKAISIWQPWASLIAVGAKQYETRSWATSYRGPLLICAGLKIIKIALTGSWEFRCAVRQALSIPKGESFPHGPFGQAMAVVDLVGCYPTEEIMALWWDGRGPAEISMEINFGDFSAGRYAWKLENVRAIEPFPVRGRQGLFEVELPEGIEF